MDRNASGCCGFIRATVPLVPYLFIIVALSVPLSAHARQLPEPLVAIHVSELTQALETMPAVSPTPIASDTSGYQWWYTSWRYFVAYESLKAALASDGTPYIVVSDSDIAAGALLNSDGSPHYPILISLAAEAVADNEISALRNYVGAGGFLFVGSSAFTRNPDGTSRGNFALAAEMGLHMAGTDLFNWYGNNHLTKAAPHRLTSHIPDGSLTWNGPLAADEISWGVSPVHLLHGSHYAWQVVADSATVIANGDAGPLLAVTSYGAGQFIYHGVFQPLIGHGGYDPGMYAYLIYRRAIEWAFESFTLPIVKVSPWPYRYDAALIIRHDFEDFQSNIQGIEASAQFERSLGAKGEYYFCTGTLREDMGGDPVTVASLRRAVSSYGALIGSHNGGLRNPVNSLLVSSDYDYWHWGPDEALDTTPQGYASGKAYASASLLASFQDIEGWLSGLDNGRSGCGATASCPRTWVAPYFNSTREDSRDLLDQLGAVVSMGEQKISPFPHKSLSYTSPGKYFSTITLPVSDWYIGTTVAQSVDNHTLDSLHAGVDFYYNLGALINFYGHFPSNNGNSGTEAQEYVTYSMAKPRLWAANSVDINDWWRVRSAVTLAPAISMSDNLFVVSTPVSGATNSATAIEMVLPKIQGQPASATSVYLNGVLARSSDYRITTNGVKILVGPSVATVQVHYSVNTSPVASGDSYSATLNTTLAIAAPGVLNNDSDPEGAALTAQLVSAPSHGTLTLSSNGSFTYTPATNYTGSDSFTYRASDGSLTSPVATVTLTVSSTVVTLFFDDFTRNTGTPDPLSPWTVAMGTWTVTGGVLQGSGTDSEYASVYTPTTPTWSDYSVEGLVRFPAGAFGGGLGGRLNPSTGAHYGAWIYPDGSLGGANTLKLVKFSDWTTWSGVPMKVVNLPSVGTGWHALKLVFNGSRIQVYYDGALMIDVTDSYFDSVAAYASGGISVDMWTYTMPYVMGVDTVVVSTLTGNQAPVAGNDSYNTNQNTVLTVAAPGVLGNDSDPEGTTLTAQLVSGPSHGTLTLSSTGSFTYTPTTNYTGSDSFTYRASDGSMTSPAATVTITVVPAVVLNSLSLSPTTVTGGISSRGTVTLSGAAPSGGVVVSLSDNSSSASVPASVTVASGSTSAAFTISTTRVYLSKSATISASYGGVTKKAVLRITP